VKAQDMTQQGAGNTAIRELDNTRWAEDRAMAAVWNRSNDARKVTSPQSESTGRVLRHNIHRQQQSTRPGKQIDSNTT
jgi:hypothetical protein